MTTRPAGTARDSGAGRPTRAARRGNLPTIFTSFVGREREVAEVSALFATARPLSLIGTGGVGKTRLALQVAGTLADAFPDGVWYVDLAPLADPGLVPQAVATVLGVREPPEGLLIEALAERLEPCRLLLVLDNCEHLAAACSELADYLHRSAQRLRILVTSRQPLDCPGEVAWRVPSLGVPDPSERLRPHDLEEFEAVRLFAERAAVARSSFRLTAENASAVAEVCHRLDGIPLALELAASRVKVLSVEQIAERLDDRFRLLTSAQPAALNRHRTLRALVDWSYDLLTERERLLLGRLSVFAGSCTLEAAEAVCSDREMERRRDRETERQRDGETESEGTPLDLSIAPGDVLDLLGQLIDRSLVSTDERAGVARYRLPETIRQYAAEKLGGGVDEAALRAHHLAWCLELAEQAEPGLLGRDQKIWYARLDADLDNVRAALNWATERQEVWAGLGLAGALAKFWEVHGHLGEGRQRLAMLLDLPTPEDSLAVRARALQAAGHLAFLQGDYRNAQIFDEESLEIRRRLGDEASLAASLNNLGLVETFRGDFAAARALFEQAVASARGQTDRVAEAMCLNNLARVVFFAGDLETARGLQEQGLALRRLEGDSWGIGICLNDLGDIMLAEGEHARARDIFEESLAIWQELADRWGIAFALEGFAGLALAESQAERGLCLLAAAGLLREAIGVPGLPIRQARLQGMLDSARQALDEQRYRSAWTEGRELSLEEAVALALTDPPAGDSGRPTAPAGDGQLPLTRRELEVATLIARGFTNRLIATDLIITEGTAANHVKHILDKLGFDSRSQIAAWAVEHGLLKSQPD